MSAHGPQYFVDFSTCPLGDGVPDGWSEPWDTSSNWTITTNPDAGNVLRNTGTLTGYRRLLTLDMADADAHQYATQETVLKWRLSGDPRAVLRATGATGSENAIWSGHNYSGVSLGRYIAGDSSSIAHDPVTIDPDLWHITRTRVEGDQLRSRTWLAGQVEPSTWGIQVTFAGIPGPGSVGILAPVGRQAEFAFFGVGLDGAPAPTYDTDGLLVTPFEARGHQAPWTSIQEGNDYLDALTSLHASTISEEQVGVSVDGAPMRLFKIGTGARKIFIVCQQHGQELSGREAALTLLRDWASTTDPVMLSYLQQATVLVMPTAHPDNITTRENSHGVNLNRDHIQLTQPETQAIHKAIRDHRPDIIIDVHEGRNITNNYATGPTLNGNIPSSLIALSETLEGEVRDAVTNAGYTWERYQGNRAMIGAENLANHTGIQNRLGLLLESRRSDGHDDDAQARHHTQIIALQAIVEWHQQNIQEVYDAVTTAQVAVSQRTTPVQLMTGTLPFNGPVLDPLPSGYELTHAQKSEVDLHLQAFDILATETSGAWHISTAQASQNVLAYLVDPESPEGVIQASRSYDYDPEPPVDPPAPIPSRGIRRRHTTISSRVSHL